MSLAFGCHKRGIFTLIRAHGVKVEVRGGCHLRALRRWDSNVAKHLPCKGDADFMSMTSRPSVDMR